MKLKISFAIVVVFAGKSIYSNNRRYISSCADIFAKSLIYSDNRRYKFHLLTTLPPQNKKVPPQGDTIPSITSLPNPTHAPFQRIQYLIRDVHQHIMQFVQDEAHHLYLILLIYKMLLSSSFEAHHKIPRRFLE